MVRPRSTKLIRPPCQNRPHLNRDGPSCFKSRDGRLQRLCTDAGQHDSGSERGQITVSVNRGSGERGRCVRRRCEQSVRTRAKDGSA